MVSAWSRSRCASSGKKRLQSRTTSKVPIPPISAAGTVPNQAAVTPDSNSPNSLDVPMNMALTALTRPRISSGVSNCTSVERMTTLNMSDQPSTTSAANDRTNDVERAKTMVEMDRHRMDRLLGADRRRGTQEAESPRACSKNIPGIDGQEGGRASEQHCEQVE